jgi:D-psicose/D-tagatose/L-ribulose 3-epimerase
LGKARAPPTTRSRDNVVGGLREFAAEAAPPGVTLRLKTHNRSEVNVLNTARDALIRADDIGSDHVS